MLFLNIFAVRTHRKIQKSMLGVFMECTWPCPLQLTCEAPPSGKQSTLSPSGILGQSGMMFDPEVGDK